MTLAFTPPVTRRSWRFFTLTPIGARPWSAAPAAAHLRTVVELDRHRRERERYAPAVAAEAAALAHVLEVEARERRGAEHAAVLEAAALPIDCRRCGALPGEPCDLAARNRRVRYVLRGTSPNHAERLDDAARAAARIARRLRAIERDSGLRLWLELPGVVRAAMLVSTPAAQQAAIVAELAAALPALRWHLETSAGRWWPELTPEGERP